jgi:hypothetical protein
MIKINLDKKENNQEKRLVNIHSAAIHIENKVKLISRQAWFFMVYKAFPDLLTKDIFTISLVELKEEIGYNSTNNKYLKQALRELIETTVEWNILNKDKNIWEINTLLAGFKIEEGTGICQYAFSPFLRTKLANPEMYMKLDLLISKKFNSKHSLAIYSLALDYLQVKNNYGEKNLTVEELRKYLGLKDDDYPRVVNINKEIIKKAEKEISTNTDLNISIIPLRTTNRKITGFKFQMSIKEEHLDFYKPKKLSEQIIENRQPGLFDLIEAPENKKEAIPKPTKVKKALIKVEGPDLKKYFAKHKISITTDTVQNKLKEIQEMLHDKLENYLIFLMDYVEQEANKKTITSLSGFYIGLLKDDSQLENYLCYLQEQQTREEDKKTRIKALIEPELQKRYEKYILSDFEKYLEKNIAKLETKMIKLIKSTLEGGNFLYDVVITRGNKGIIDSSLITASKPMYKNLLISHLNNYSKDLGYEGISFAEWKEQELTEKYLQGLKTEIEKSL